jgi:hypothetical protein
VPVGDGQAREDLRRSGNLQHCLTFKVRDLKRAVAHLEPEGTALETQRDDVVITNPASSHGRRFGFTESLVPGDPRA